MKKLLNVLALSFAVSLPAMFGAEQIGVSLPAGLNAIVVFAGFVVSVVLLTAFGGYSRQRGAVEPTLITAANTRGRKAVYPLAA